MAYSKHNFDGNQMIYASDLKDMDDTVYKNNAFQNSNVQISKEKNIIKVYCGGLEPQKYYTIKLKRRSRSNGRTGRWIGIKEFGYAKLIPEQASNKKLSIAERNAWKAADIPTEMSNTNGLLPSEFNVQANSNGEIYLSFNAKTFFLPLAKPINNYPFGEHLTQNTAVGLVGLEKKKVFRELHFTFWLYDLSDNLISKSNEYLGFGAFITNEQQNLYLTENIYTNEIEFDNIRTTIY